MPTMSRRWPRGVKKKSSPRQHRRPWDRQARSASAMRAAVISGLLALLSDGVSGGGASGRHEAAEHAGSRSADGTPPVHGGRRRQQDAAGDAAAHAAAPPWVETSGFTCHPNARWELQPGLTNGKPEWATSSEGTQWFLYHRPASHHYWAIDSAADDSSAPVGKTDTSAEDGGPVPRSSNVLDDLHAAWKENCDDPILGDDGRWPSNHGVTVRAPLSLANCAAITEQAAAMPGCGALRGGKAGCSGCEQPWIAMAVAHPIMWRDASECSWAAACVDEALGVWAARFPDALALCQIRDAQPAATHLPSGGLSNWVDFTDPCPTWGDNTLLGGWDGVVCNGTRVVALGLVHPVAGSDLEWPAAWADGSSLPLLLDAGGDRFHVAADYSSDGLQSCGLAALPPDSMAAMTEIRYIDLILNDLTELPSTICDMPALTTLELLYNTRLESLPECLCESNTVKSLVSTQALP